MDRTTVSRADGEAQPRRLPLALLLLPILVLLGLGFMVPLGRLIFNTFVVDGQFSLEPYADAVAISRYFSVLTRTFLVAVLTSLACLLIGYPLAYVIARLPRRFALPLLVVVTIPFFTTTLIRSYAWIAILGSNGLIENLLGDLGVLDPPRMAFNFTGMMIGIIQVQLPLMVLPLYSVMSRIDRSRVLAAQSLGAVPAKAFWHAYRPATMPGVAAGVSLVFITTLGFYVTPAMLGGPGDALVAQTIQVQFSSLGDSAGAAAQATVLLAIVLVLVMLLGRNMALALPGADLSTVDGQEAGRLSRARRTVRIPSIGRGGQAGRSLRALRDKAVDGAAMVISAVRWPVLAVAATVGFLYLALPMIVVVLWAFSAKTSLQFPPTELSVRWFGTYFSDPAWLGSTLFSVTIAILSASLAVVVGGLGAYWLVRSSGRGRSFVLALCMAPLIIPGIVYALAYFLVIAPLGLHSTWMAFVVVYAVLGVPFSSLIISAGLRNLDPSFERAGSSLGASPFAVTRLIIAPLLAAALVSSFVFAFIIGFDDVVIALFIAGPAAYPLPLRMWNDIYLEASPLTAAIAVTLFTVTATILGSATLVRIVGRRRG